MIATELFKWSDDYSVNIPAIDEQHKVLVGLVNQLHVAIIEHRGTAAAREVLERLSDYTHSHFQLEERLMVVSHYPELEAHRQQHKYLIDQLQNLQDRLHHENKPIAFELLYVLKQWLAQHIGDSDKRFGAHFVKARREQNADLGFADGQAIKKKTWWKR